MKTKIYQFDPVIYPYPLLVCKYVPGATAKEIAEYFNAVVDKRTVRVIGDDELNAHPTLTAHTICVVDKADEYMKYLVILYQPKMIRWGIVAHESLHILNMLNDWVGIDPIELKNDEPHAYLIGWLANCIGSVIDGHPEKMKGELLEF